MRVGALTGFTHRIACWLCLIIFCSPSPFSLYRGIVFAQKKQKFKLHIPRITVEELAANDTLRSGHHAYVIKDFVKGRWAAENWTVNHLKDKIGFEWVDYYPDNMNEMGKKPYLFKLKDAVPKFNLPHHHPRYMQMRISVRGWNRLRKDLAPLPIPEVFWSDEEWISKCMVKENGKPDMLAIDNFYTTNQWKFLLIGEKGTNMFFHKDGTAASSWQAQLVGKKKWTLCPNSESHLLNVEVNTYKPDYKRFPNFAKAKCGQVTAEEGDLLYYPAYWWHHAWNMETPTICYTGALVGVEANRDDVRGTVHGAFLDDLKDKCSKCWTPGKPDRHCDDISIQWPGAAPPPFRIVCESYLDTCLKMWDKHVNELFQRKGSEEL